MLMRFSGPKTRGWDPDPWGTVAGNGCWRSGKMCREAQGNNRFWLDHEGPPIEVRSALPGEIRKIRGSWIEILGNPSRYSVVCCSRFLFALQRHRVGVTGGEEVIGLAESMSPCENEEQTQCEADPKETPPHMK
jgi:hypothetical protein